jgi:hypothetical protein
MKNTTKLCVVTDGRKLPPYTVLKGKILPKINVEGIKEQAEESGWMDQSPVAEWINMSLRGLLEHCEILTAC